MQPPPRKVKPAVSLKNIQADQVSKLTSKHQQECDILEDMRTFFSRKATLEKEYAQGLLKVTSQLLKREFPAQPDLNCEDGQEHKTVCAVWRTVLEESDRLAKARLQAADVYSEKVAEPLKPAKAVKVQCFKKIMPQLSVIHAEVAQCIMDLVKTQKSYMAEGGLAHEARQKSSDAEDKLKRKSTGIFQTLASLQKSCSKLRARTEASEVKETAARNEYLLSLAAANAHQIRYYSTDLPDVMKTLDCDVYEKIQESLTVSGQLASEIAEKEATFFHSIAIEAAKICREFSQQCYLFQNPVFTNLVQYQFEPCLGDTCNKLTSDNNAGPDLEKEARKWSTRVAKETRSIRDYYRQMTVVQSIKTGDRVSESGSQESTVTDPEGRLEELRQSIRKAEVTKLKAEARLEALRLGGVNVDEWINQAQMESLVAEESGLTRTPSQISLRTESSGGQSANDDHEPTYTHYDEDDDFIDDTFSPAASGSSRIYPVLCKALYDFQASNYDEMTITAGDGLELVADGDGDGWVKAKNLLGQEGYIPETYVDLGGQSNISPPLGVEDMNAINDTISESVTPASSSQQRQQPPSMVQTPAPDLQSPTSVDLQQDTASSYSSGDLEVQQTIDVMATGEHVMPAKLGSSTEISWARALFDYEAQTEEELSFLEGSLIRVLRKDDMGVDDGFWEGECNGRFGMFPSLVVEEIAGPPDDPLSPGLVVAVQPDASMPPPVHVTLPTPENEPPPPPSLSEGEAADGDECLPPPPPSMMPQCDPEEDSQSTPTPTADQSPKRVRFQQQDISQTQHTSPHNQHHVLTRQLRPTNTMISKSNTKRSSRISSSDHHHHQHTTVSPMLRHKSLPNSLNMAAAESIEIQQQQQQQPQAQSPQSSPQSPVLPHQHSNISHSQSHLSSLSRTTSPTSWKHDHRHRHHHKHHQHKQLQHYPSDPLSVNSETEICPENSLSMSQSDTSYCGGQQWTSLSQSYPSSPLGSPQCEDLSSLLRVSLHPQTHDSSTSGSPHKPLLNFRLYTQIPPDVCHRQKQHSQLAPTGASGMEMYPDVCSRQKQQCQLSPTESPNHSFSSGFSQHSSLAQSSSGNSHRPISSQHHQQPLHLDCSQPNMHSTQSQTNQPYQVTSSQQPHYSNTTLRQLPQQINTSYQSQQPQHQCSSPEHNRSQIQLRAASHKLSVFCRVNYDDWESEEGEESLV